MTLNKAVPTPSRHDRVRSLLERVKYRRAYSIEDREEIYRFRYDAYRREGAIDARQDLRLLDRFDRPSSMLFGIYIDTRLVASIRICVARRLEDDTPAMDAFPDELKPIVKKGATIIDPNRFVTDKSYPELPYLALRVPFLASAWFGADFVTATVRREHIPFYARVLQCNLICNPRPYPTLIKPLALMMVSFPNEAERVLMKYPFFAERPGESEHLFSEMN